MPNPGQATRKVTTRLWIEPLKTSHLDELAHVLLNPDVYEHIEEKLPTLEDFKLGMSRAIAGPGGEWPGQIWLNYLVRDAGTGSMLGRLESTVHDSLAEVAFLFGPQYWGKGYASEGLAWLQAEVQRKCGVREFWATTVPANTRCQSLLLRNGYSQVHGLHPNLLSYAPGDLVFHLSVGSFRLPTQG
jgi:RimJ/RimL family protein N-acetyltransferase